jgi:hypothetical protein
MSVPKWKLILKFDSCGCGLLLAMLAPTLLMVSR